MRSHNWIFAVLCFAGWSLWAQPTNVLLPTTSPKTAPAPALAFDSMLKEYEAKVGETAAAFTFNLTNISSTELVVNGTQTTCGCTVAKLPSQPWKMAPGESGQIQVTVNLAGKSGTVTKGVTVLTSAGAPMVQVRIKIPAPTQMSESDRARNVDLSKADAQAIFRGDCASCHVVPAKGRMGGDLFLTMCGVCHESNRRASMVPNLHGLLKTTDYDFWKTAITFGRTNSLMPAFALSQGGPLTEEQVNSLADFLNKSISRNFTTPAPGSIKTLAPESVVIPPETSAPSDARSRTAPRRPAPGVKF